MTLQSLIASALTLALALGAASSIQAQEANTAAGALPQWTAEPAKADHAKDIPSDEALLRQHLAGGDSAPSGSVGPAQKTRPNPTAVGAPGASQGARDDAGNSLAAAVKDFVKPLNEEINNSSVVQAVREIDATVSGRAQAQGAEKSPGYSQRGTDGTGAARADRKTDPNAAALMWQQFVDEVLPWAIGGALACALGYGGYFWLKLIKHKNLKHGNKRRAVRRNRQSERHSDRHSARRAPSGEMQAQAAVPAAEAPLNPASSGSSRSSRSSSRRSSSRTSSRSSSRTSDGSTP